MSQKITISPLTRIEGHLAIKTDVTDGKVTQAWTSGEMFRGFENILRGRDPLDAQQITQRICGVCSVEHGIASILAQDMAYGVVPPDNGRIVRNLIQGASFIMSHITHFYLLSALDFVDVTAITGYQGKEAALNGLKAWVQTELAGRKVLPAAPFLPRYTAEYIKDRDLNLGALRHYLESLEMRKAAHQMGAIFCGKLPHAPALIPGGVTDSVTAWQITAYRAILERLRNFIESAYIPDVLAVAQSFPAYFALGKGCGNFLSYGVFPESADGKVLFLGSGTVLQGKWSSLSPDAITEDVASSFFSSQSGLKPESGETVAAPDKQGAYSWLKAPRYQGQPMEVGPLARISVVYHEGRNRTIISTVDALLKTLGKTPVELNSVMGRHAARAVECLLIADQCGQWLEQLQPDKPVFTDFVIPDTGQGQGLTEAARGALGHWIQIRNRKIHNYQCIVPTTWNASPRDDRGIAGPIEQALVGTTIADADNPMEAARVVRSFDPCIACAVH
jgi:ferredoxin hydrogenase large subunit/hydrogenase large subunit